MISFTAFVVVVLIVIIIVFVFKREFVHRPKVSDFPVKFPDDKNKEQAIDRDWYDVAIVGAGPAGSTCAYFLAKMGWKCLLLEKKKFPRDKYCGDAVLKTAIEILMEMGVYEQLIKENKAYVFWYSIGEPSSGCDFRGNMTTQGGFITGLPRDVMFLRKSQFDEGSPKEYRNCHQDSGGMCSPGGLSFIGQSMEGYGEIPAALACKRILLDETLAMAAKRMGADLREESPVSDAIFNEETGLWRVSIEDDTAYRARVLLCCDGATSRLATQLGIVTKPPDSSCSRAYVEGGTHKFKADGLVVYNKELLPGYAGLFRHPNDVLNYCCYIIPGNPKCTQENVAYWHDYLIAQDPSISKALGSDFKMERMKVASLRLGGEKQTYDRHCLVIGDAAGMTDPLTGEGIHGAMEGGKIAAHFLNEVITHGNYDKEVMAIYQQRWMDKFGFDFKWSMIFCQLTYRFPILLDAATAAVQRKGDQMFLKWADIMTGRVPKINLLRPEFSVVITFELIRLILLKIVGKSPAKDKTD